MKKALFIRSIAEFAEGYSRIYFGNEFCENLIPTLASIKKIRRFCAEREIDFTFVSPFVTQAGLTKLFPLLSYLNEYGPTEVVCNDWGVFSTAAQRWKNLDLVVGRLLTKQRRDPRMLPIMSNKQAPIAALGPGGTQTIIIPRSCPEEVFDHHRASVINVPAFQSFLRANNARRVEVDNLLWDMHIAAGRRMGVSLYLPYGYVSTTRMCARLRLGTAPCNKDCRKHYYQLDDKSLPTPLFTIGNTVFYRSPAPSAASLRTNGIDRIVYQPGFPF